MTNALGARMIARYKEGTATREQLDTAYDRGWISDEDYEAATTESAPEEEPTA